ncbi:hypothetical protein LSTR_LSTR001867 [Laodelphax striatellus]|uniref:Uncharacterized protein n=1 Tax=Laodelphax striatellus TaxID=195883 RepID=A0A482WFY1_LAOST|nr:hypothetical protein LSTR_LSTR001867 [Laodelphax striatellus]
METHVCQHLEHINCYWQFAMLSPFDRISVLKCEVFCRWRMAEVEADENSKVINQNPLMELYCGGGESTKEGDDTGH